jgi:hypothetical protein
MLKKNSKRLHGQSILEYVLLIGIITVALFAMMQMVKRGTQSLVKVAADEIGNQSNSDQSFDNRQGYLDSSNSLMDSSGRKNVLERIGVINYVTSETQTTLSNTITNMGITEGQ